MRLATLDAGARDFRLSTVDYRLSTVDCSSHRAHVRQHSECSSGRGVPSRIQVHSFVHASSQTGGGADSVGMHHLHVRGRCRVSIMPPACAITMPAVCRANRARQRCGAVEISHDCEIFLLAPGVIEPILRASGVASELLIASADGASRACDRPSRRSDLRRTPYQCGCATWTATKKRANQTRHGDSDV